MYVFYFTSVEPNFNLKKEKLKKILYSLMQASIMPGM